MNTKHDHNRGFLHPCLWAIVVWLALLPSLSAQPYFLLSDLAPIGTNPYTNAPMVHVTDNVWIVDDTGFTPPEKFKTKLTAEQARVELFAAMEKNAAVQAARALTNPPTASGRSATNHLMNVPSGMRRIWYGGREIHVTTNANIGHAIQALELDYPGISTNFSPEQLKNRPPSTNQWWKTAKQLPAHINRRSPTFEEDLARWKKENGFTNSPPTRARTNAIPP